MLLDAHGGSAALSALWPIETATDDAIAEWHLHAAAPDVRVDEFSPARYGDGPWGAPVATAIRADARVLLDQSGRPLIAERSMGSGAFVWIGGNLLYHSKAYGNQTESDFLMGLVGPLRPDVSVSGSGSLVDPERRLVSAGSARGVFVSESYHPKWTATWSDGSSLHVYFAGPGLMYVPTPAREGNLTLEVGRTWTDLAVWVLVGLGLFVCAWRRTAQIG